MPFIEPIDSEQMDELWQITDLYSDDGYVLEELFYTFEGNVKTPEHTFWPKDKRGAAIEGWLISKTDIDLLVREGEGLLTPDPRARAGWERFTSRRLHRSRSHN